ncbi:MAG: ABC transporter ATP-binding protein, partial [Myxococcales bacterium]
NGSGKSTLLKVLAGALRPDRGQVRVAGDDVATRLDAVRRRVALLGHSSFTYDSLSARENLDIVARYVGTPDRQAAIGALLEQVGLAHRALDPVASFSAGMRKRLALARVLLQQPEVALLDEPYGELDPPGFRFVDALIPALQAKGTTVLLASHLLERGAELCDRGVVLEQGKVAFVGDSRELLVKGGLAPAGSARLQAGGA